MNLFGLNYIDNSNIRKHRMQQDSISEERFYFYFKLFYLNSK